MRQASIHSRGMSVQTAQLLRIRALDKKFAMNPAEVLLTLDEQVKKSPDPDAVFALAELSYLTARKFERVSKKQALSLYAGTVAFSYFYLFDDSIENRTNPYDPRFRQASDLYNSALAKCIRLAQKRDQLIGDTLHFELAGGKLDVAVRRRGLLWKSEEFDKFLFASDYEVEGMANHYHNFGLGVPLIATRKPAPSDDPKEKYYPAHQSLPVTAFLRMDSTVAGPAHHARKATLELYDPLQADSVDVGSKKAPLESDLTTPLGYFLANAKLERFELEGLLRTDKVSPVSGLFMVQPYEKGKIPVVMIHGLWSSPLTWMHMFNDLRADPAVRDRYQFWFYLYPTGSPFLYSAEQLRQSLRQVIRDCDPKGEDPALDQMVLVGHSMGGVLAKLMTQHSDGELWRQIANRPVEQIQALPREKEMIEKVYFYEPQPYVRRVIFLATPHRGSQLSEKPIGRLISRLISLPTAVVKTRDDLIARNPGVFNENFQEKMPTSVDNLAPDSPVIQATARLKIAPGVVSHTIMGNLYDVDPKLGSDGIVPYASSHLDEAESEYVVKSGHNCHTHPLAVLEVRRILLEHLADIQRGKSDLEPASNPTTPESPVTQASATANAPQQATPAPNRPTRRELIPPKALGPNEVSLELIR
jgi:pimeloyl-ACP methyl ester carboxylesterase